MTNQTHHGSHTDYSGRTAVITGGTHGMGMGIARRLIDGGARVLVTGRNEANVEAARAELGEQAQVVRSDSASLADIDTLGGTVEKALGQVDAVFINAGVAKLEPFEQVTEETFDWMFNVNTKGAFFSAQRLLPLVRDGGALVFTTVTGGGGGGTPNMSAYLGSKAAIWAAAQSIGSEALPRKVRVNAVAPGFIDTPTLGVVGASPEERASLQEAGDVVTPMQRHGTIDEVALAALFLAFRATFTTGHQLQVDGGIADGLLYPA